MMRRLVLSVLFFVFALAAACSAKSASIYGDASGDGLVDISDVQIVMRVAVGLSIPSPEQIRVADVYPNPGTFGREVGDGAVNISDAALILRYIFGLIASLGPIQAGLDVSFLYSGPNATQKDVAPDALSSKQIAVLRGRVLSTSGSPLPGVTVSVLRHPEFGRVATRSDGSFDMVVNGGTTLTVEYRMSGYLTAQRKVQVPWRDYVFLPIVVATPMDSLYGCFGMVPPSSSTSTMQTATAHCISLAQRLLSARSTILTTAF
jgi:hypothetical protein